MNANCFTQQTNPVRFRALGLTQFTDTCNPKRHHHHHNKYPALHAQFYAQFMARHEPMRETAEESQALDAIRREIGNVHAAWEWTMAHI